MKNKILNIISSFSSSDIKELSRYIVFSAPNRSQQHIDLITYVKKQIESEAEFDKEECFRTLFPGLRYEDVKLRLLQSDTVRIVEKYITYKALEEDRLFNSKALLSYYKEKNLNDLYKKTLQKYVRQKEEGSGQQKLLYDFFLLEEIYTNAIAERQVGKTETQDLLDLLDKEYIVRKLRYSCLTVSQENVYDIHFDHGIRNEIVEHIEKKQLYNDPAIGLYYYCYQMLSTQGEFQHFYEYLKRHGGSLADEQRKELFTLSINFCIRSLNQGDKTFGRIGIEFYQEGLRNGILLRNGKISRFTFRNIVTMAVRIEEFELAEKFIKQYSDMLDRRERDNMMTFTTSIVLFSKKEFEEASKEVIKTDFKDVLFNLATKALQAKIYFEIGEIWLLRSHLDAMQIFLKRQKSLGYHKKNYLNMIAYMRKLTNAKSLEKLEKLNIQLAAEPTLIEKIWFEEKVSIGLEIHSKRKV